MNRRTYGQTCALALALDAIGERWTLLIVRDLLLGPLRYKDLQDGLPGISTNLLSTRLHHLEEIGLVEKATLPPPAGSSVYQLTPDGRSLGPAIAALGTWGVRFIAHAPVGSHRSAAWAVQGLAFMADLDQAADTNDSYEFQLDGESFLIHAHGGSVRAERGSTPKADVVVETTVETMRSLRHGEQVLDDGDAGLAISVLGDAAAVERCAAILRLPWLRLGVREGADV
ncbi:MAG: winged helix-turn-helix transcriptional regulator [Acidimicrobiia bacterium]|nr:MAG: winged helix-turn-helix transcriptional regulator [Acidimicrobiia bacterium]